MYYWDEVVAFVSAANIAGHLEEAGIISVSDDEDLTVFIIEQDKLYSYACNKAMDEHPGDSGKWPNWYDWFTDALKKEYGK